MKRWIRSLAFLWWVIILTMVVGCSPVATATDIEVSQMPSETITFTAQPSATLFATAMITASPKPTNTILPAATATVPPSPEPVQPAQTTFSMPVEYFISNISGHKQYFALGCETAAAKDWANFFGYDFNEFNFQYDLPVSDNPDFGFVGDVNSAWGQVPPYAYGVHAGPIADLLNVYGIPAKAVKGMTVDELKHELAQGRPVIVWVIGNVVGGVPYEYTDSKGNTTIVAAYEHVVIATGYGEAKIRYMNNGKLYDSPTDVFMNSWSVLGYLAVIAGD